MRSAQPVAELLDEVRQCTLCAGHLPLGPRPVVQVGPTARILVAGQAPGRRVHGSGVPFDDPSGERLRAWMGVDRATFHDARRVAILPMGFCYPGTAASGDLPPRAECAPTWRQRLLASMPDIALTLVIGRYAQSWHCPAPARSVTDRVRDWQSGWPHQLALPHPSPRNNRWLRQNPWFETEVLPRLRERVSALIAGAGDST